MAYRRTLKRGVGCTGIGLHTGRAVRLDLKPAPADHGIRFRRTDVGVEIPAHIDHLGRLDHATTLSRDGVSIDTVEHLLSALYSLGVDDVLVEVDGPEVPVMDGSAAPFVILIHEAGLRPHKVSRRYLKMLRPVEVVRGAPCDLDKPPEGVRVSLLASWGADWAAPPEEAGSPRESDDGEHAASEWGFASHGTPDRRRGERYHCERYRCRRVTVAWPGSVEHSARHVRWSMPTAWC
jgi:hypothetical protein